MSADDEFFKYYAEASESKATLERFAGVKVAMERVAEKEQIGPGPWTVGDVGCGAGTQCLMWARAGHKVHGVDINEKLVTLGAARAARAGLAIDFNVGTATKLPWPDQSMQIVLCPELLEHVADWEGVVSELVRVVAPGGLMLISTTNWLCPRQEEFDLPAYSWYPAPLKRRYVRLATTTRPELANHAKYPAVHWFSYYGLRRHLARFGFRCMDRFDVAALGRSGGAAGAVLAVLRATPLTRFVGHLLSSYTLVVARRVAA